MLKLIKKSLNTYKLLIKQNLLILYLKVFKKKIIFYYIILTIYKKIKQSQY